MPNFVLGFSIIKSDEHNLSSLVLMPVIDTDNVIESWLVWSWQAK